MKLKAIKATVEENQKQGKDNIYEGLDSAEIGRYSQALMFGDDDEAFPSQEEWSRWVD